MGTLLKWFTSEIGIRITIALIMFIVALGSVWAIRHVGFLAGEKSKQAEWDAAVKKTIEEKLDVKGKQDEVQKSPIDNDTTMRRLRKGTF